MSGAEVAVAVAAVSVAATAATAGVTISQQKEATDYNSKIAKDQALAATQKAEADAAAADFRNRRIMAEQRARISASGDDPASGSALTVLSQQASIADIERRQILSQGGAAATSELAQANLFRYQGQSAAVSGGLGALSSSLGAAGSAYGAYQSAQTNAAIRASYTK